MSLIAPLLQTPHTFAVVGVSQDPSKYGYEVFESLLRHGHHVLPVNPKYEAIDDQACHASLRDLPRLPDVVITAISASATSILQKPAPTWESQFFGCRREPSPRLLLKPAAGMA